MRMMRVLFMTVIVSMILVGTSVAFAFSANNEASDADVPVTTEMCDEILVDSADPIC